MGKAHTTNTNPRHTSCPMPSFSPIHDVTLLIQQHLASMGTSRVELTQKQKNHEQYEIVDFRQISSWTHNKAITMPKYKYTKREIATVASH